jgi:type IV pilus assembly protein PilW
MSFARGELHKASRQVEAGRYALQILSDEVRHAGYYGALTTPPAPVAALPDPCSFTLANVQTAMGLPLQGYAVSGATPPVTCLTGAAVGYRADTAILVTRRANTANTACAAGNDLFCIQVSGCPGDTARYVLNTANVDLSAFTLHANGLPGCSPINAAPAAVITPYYTRIYFISNCSGTDCSAAGADSIPTLKRMDITPTVRPITPIVDGIENIQFEYGIDSTPAIGDGNPDVYRSTPANINEWNDVVTVRIHLLARNVESSGQYVDAKVYQLGAVSYTPTETGFKRHAYNELVRLNNPSGRRE